ncbi:MAG TPA: carbohydrate ABC transporter permease [Candidatus Ruthenibacterium merdavium]|uniref:Carbohydrate ABC transporter permease n=1 Tax=Candidatus Ruthenibacterium merdavium TaxID=2838752 RepID=A0A9D2Q841_9FIRM|nr:carbohydrate ABC transporter permease [Candidatus Ruthenibacterium merdavium]
MTVRARNHIATFLKYVVLIAVGFVMIYPLLWMIGATFKTNNEIFSGIGIFPKNPTLQGYIDALNNYGGDIDILRSMINTYSYVIPKVLFTVISSLVTAYGFGRFNFKGKNFFFALMLCMLFLPQVVLNVPQYLLFNNFGWVDSQWYAALIIPTLFATESYFIFMLVQFMRGVPRDLDEAAQIDGCNSFQTLCKVIAPMLSPALISVALFQFMWSSNDFMGPLLYVKTPQRYPAALFVKLSMDADSGFAWNRVLAVSVISILPSLIVFFLAQNKFVDGISAGSVKG